MMLIIYRFISILLNVVAIMLAFSLVMSLPMIFTSPINMLSAFMIICIVLYTCFSNRFSRHVLQQQKPVNPKLRDWVRVNGIVSLIYSILIITAAVFLLTNPSITTELMKNIPANMPVEEADLRRLFIFMLVYASFLLIHILLTFSFMKKFREYFSKVD